MTYWLARMSKCGYRLEIARTNRLERVVISGWLLWCGPPRPERHAREKLSITTTGITAWSFTRCETDSGKYVSSSSTRRQRSTFYGNNGIWKNGYSGLLLMNFRTIHNGQIVLSRGKWCLLRIIVYTGAQRHSVARHLFAESTRMYHARRWRPLSWTTRRQTIGRFSWRVNICTCFKSKFC